MDEKPVIVHNVEEVDGGLLIGSKDGGYEPGVDDGVLLYRTVAGGVDFDVQVKLIGGDFPTFLGEGEAKYHNSAGIVVKNPDHTVSSFLYLMFFDIWGGHHHLKSAFEGANLGGYGVRNTADANDATVPYYTIAEYPYLRLTRTENIFKSYTSKDGVEWVESGSVERADFEGIDLQVGLSQCNFYSHLDIVDWAYIEDPAYTTTAILDDFKLTHSPDGVPASVNKTRLAKDVKAFFNPTTRSIQVKASASEINKVSIYSIDGKLVQSNSGLTGNSYSVPMNKRGIYIVSVETKLGKTVSKISVI